MFNDPKSLIMTHRKLWRIALAVLPLAIIAFASDGAESGPKTGMRPDDPAADRGLYPEPEGAVSTVVVPGKAVEQEVETEAEEGETEIEAESEGPRGVKAHPPGTVDVVVGPPAGVKAVILPPEPEPAVVYTQNESGAPLVVIGEPLPMQPAPGAMQVEAKPLVGTRLFDYHRRPASDRYSGNSAPYVNRPTPTPVEVELEPEPELAEPKPHHAKKPLYEKRPLQQASTVNVVQHVNIAQDSAPVFVSVPAPRYTTAIYNVPAAPASPAAGAIVLPPRYRPNPYPEPTYVPAKVSVEAKIRSNYVPHPNAVPKNYQHPVYRVANAQSQYPLGHLISSSPRLLDQPTMELPPRYPTPLAPSEAPRYYPSSMGYQAPQNPARPQPAEPVVTEEPAPAEPSAEPSPRNPEPTPPPVPPPSHYRPPQHVPAPPAPRYEQRPTLPGPPSVSPTRPGYATALVPQCSAETGLLFCLHDSEYPLAEINGYIALYPDKYHALRPMVSWTPAAAVPSARPYGYPGSAPQIRSHYSNLEHQPVGPTRHPDSCPSVITPAAKVFRATNEQHKWKVIVQFPESIQTSLIDTCQTNATCGGRSPGPQTECVQDYALQQLMVYSTEFGIHVDDMLIPQGCKCKILPERPAPTYNLGPRSAAPY